MQFKAAARLACTSLCSIALVHGSQMHEAQMAYPELVPLIADKMSRNTKGVTNRFLFSEVAVKAVNWTNALFVNSMCHVPLYHYILDSESAQEIVNVRAALTYGALVTVLEHSGQDDFEQSLALFKQVATPGGLVFSYYDSCEMPIVLLASGRATVRIELVKAVIELTESLPSLIKYNYPRISFALAMQYVTHGTPENWETFSLWIRHNTEFSISADLLTKLILALSTGTVDIPPQPAKQSIPFIHFEQIALNLRIVTKEILKHAPRSILNGALALDIFEPLVRELCSEIRAEEALSQSQSSDQS